MSEGPVSFGKPLLFLVLAGVGGGGFYAWKNWPAHYEGNNWEIDFPNKWEAAPFADPSDPGNERAAGKGPLIEEGMQGVAWVTVNRHGTLAWPEFPLSRIPGTPDSTEDTEIVHKKTLLFEYEDDTGTRYRGAAMQRGDAVVIAAIGCPKHLFPTNRERFDKCVKSLRVTR